MNLSITPQKLRGHVSIPASKSVMHRALICAALSEGTSVIRHAYCSEDIHATMDCLRALGASFSVEGTSITVQGITSLPETTGMDCGESGSTIRFLIPLAGALGVSATFTGRGKLITRPLELYREAFAEHGAAFFYTGTLPAQTKGTLQGGDYRIRGNISSQFITGLLLALPLLSQDSTLTVLPPFESKSYVDITISCLRSFGVTITEQDEGCYSIPGRQRYRASDYTVESDYSQAAFFLTAAALGSEVTLLDFGSESVQGDAAIVEVLTQTGFTCFTQQGALLLSGKGCKPFTVTAENIPDLVPTLCVLATGLSGTSTIRRVERLKIKESDRIASTMAMLQALGGIISYQDDCISITGAPLHGGTVLCENDHRIAMAAAMAATAASSPVILHGAECVNKSYPTFWNEYQRLGGQIHGIDLE